MRPYCCNRYAQTQEGTWKSGGLNVPPINGYTDLIVASSIQFIDQLSPLFLSSLIFKQVCLCRNFSSLSLLDNIHRWPLFHYSIFYFYFLLNATTTCYLGLFSLYWPRTKLLIHLFYCLWIFLRWFYRPSTCSFPLLAMNTHTNRTPLLTA